jgi:hypothetical protein
MPTPEPQVRFTRHPVDGPITGRFGEDYGGYLHRGVDYGVPVGTPVRAPAAGEAVPFVNDGSFGLGVCLRHADGWFTLYAHLSRADVVPGMRVEPGQQIGLSGNTGRSTGPHLHWQLCSSSAFPADIRYSRDPLDYLSEEEPMTPDEKELLLRVATVLFGSPTGLDYQSVGEALAEARRLTAQDTIVLQGLAETQRWLAQHTHGPDGRATWPGKLPF